MGYYATQTFSTLIVQPVIGKGESISVSFAPSQNIPRGTVLGQVTTTGLVKPYVHGNSDGTQTPKYIAIYDMQIDASGNITLSPTSGQIGGDWGQQSLQAPVWYKGQFAVNDLTFTSSTLANIVADQTAWKLTDAFTTALTGGVLDVN